MSHKTPESVSMAKIVVIGPSQSGKTPFILRNVTDVFHDSRPTIGAASRTKLVSIGEKAINLKIWDTSGQEKFQGLSSMYLREADAVMICFSIGNRGSFEAVESSLNFARKESPSGTFMLLIGNKCDLQEKEREVGCDEAEAFAQSYGLSYIEASAKENHHVNEAFELVTMEIFKKLDNGKPQGKPDSSSCSVF